MHPQVRANYLASPMLVVAFALAGRVDIDLTKEPLGKGKDGKPVFLRDIWPTLEEIQQAMSASLKPSLFEHRYGSVFEGDEIWKGLEVPEGSRYAWDKNSTYVQEPPFFTDLPPEPLAAARHQRRPRPRGAGRLGDDRPHLPRGLHPEERPRRAATSASTASSRWTGTPSAPAAATTK